MLVLARAAHHILGLLSSASRHCPLSLARLLGFHVLLLARLTSHGVSTGSSAPSSTSSQLRASTPWPLASAPSPPRPLFG
uniref:Uncharacterized protein n=1 Tax=Arundo donax TaxID=35708 RepID=A0A0A9H809_ARUDO